MRAEEKETVCAFIYVLPIIVCAHSVATTFHETFLKNNLFFVKDFPVP